MKAEDLMRGNYVRSYADVITIEEISKYYIKGFFTDANGVVNNTRIAIRHLQPIPLNESQLERLGFEKKENTDIYFIAFQGRWHYFDLKYNTYTIGQETVQIQIKHVHQLQNLFKSLTGKQLVYMK